MPTSYQSALDLALATMDALDGETFLFGTTPILGDFTGGDEGLILSTDGGKEVQMKGTLVIRRALLPDQPAIGTIIVDGDGTRYRIHKVNPDSVSWTLTLTAPNAAR